MIRAVVFDMDGLLVDSELVGLSVMQESGRGQGVELPLDLIRQTLGVTKAFSQDLYHRHYPQLDTEKLFVDFRAMMMQQAEAGKIPLKKGAKELLSALKERGIPCAVASSSPLFIVELYLRKNEIADFFDVLVTGEPGMPSKPAPDIFLKAAQQLNTSPQDCLVLEDSVNGVKAGRAAGMQVGMVPDLVPYSDALAPYCDHVLPDLSAVLPLLAL